MFQILRSVPFHDIWVGIFLFLKKKKQDNFRRVRELRRLGTKRDQESYSPDKLDV